MKRYQVYLNKKTVDTLDEATQLTKSLDRSKLLREVSDAAYARIGNLLAFFVPPKKLNYKWLENFVGTTKIKGKKQVNISENVDEIYYK